LFRDLRTYLSYPQKNDEKSAIDHLKINRYSIGTINEKGLQVDKIYSSLGRHKKEWKARFLETYKFTLTVERKGEILIEMLAFSTTYNNTSMI